FAVAGLPQLPYECVASADLDEARPELVEAVLDRLERRLGYPCFVKPANMGSSVGITRATDRTTLLGGLREAARLDPRLVVEQGVKARELECAVLGGTGPGDPLRASVLGEIRFDAEWYDYDTKYSEGTSQTLIPAPVPAEVSERARTMATAACSAVGARGLARVDFFFREAEPGRQDEGSGDLWINEINTIPGFTNQSMYPMLWAASGMPLPQLVGELIEGAREWHQRLLGVPTP
ncbi:MAG: D-alanine--D-alanine ligase, partial [Synechococcus sp.]|nr:D-alanine--D-alanine ligase [Synechococcus sp.]